MNDCVQQFLSQHPKANVQLQYQHPQRVYEMVESDQVDVGLVSYPRASRNLTASPWREEPMILVCSPRHLLAGRTSISLQELDGIKMVSYDEELPIRREIDRVLAADRVQVEVVMVFDNIETIKRAIEIDAGVGLLPEPTVKRELAAGSLTAIPITDGQFVRPLGIIRRRGKELGRTARQFIQLLNDWGNGATQTARDASDAEAAGQLVS